MTLLDVEEYRVRISKDGTCVDGAVWTRAGREWELEAGQSRANVTAAATPYAYFDRLASALENDEARLMTCGTCVFFRKAAGDDGWGGYCAWQHDEAPQASPHPVTLPVTLLSPNCHHFVYRRGPVETAARRASVEQKMRRNGNGSNASGSARFAPVAMVRRLFGTEPEVPEVEQAERSGSQPCPCCGTSMINRGFVSNVDEQGEERVFSIWRCTACRSGYLDDYREAYVGSRARDGERLYVVAPADADVAAEMAARCPRPYTKGCTCVGNRWFDEWAAELEETGRRIAHRESVVWR